VSENTVSSTVPEPMRDDADAQTRWGEYGNTSEYPRDPIRRDQRAQAARRLQERITEGLQSGPATPLTERRIVELREQAMPLTARHASVTLRRPAHAMGGGLPCGWFGLLRPDHPDVVRLLADARDLAATLCALGDA